MDSQQIDEILTVAIDHIRARWQDYEWYLSPNFAHSSYILSCRIGEYISQHSIKKHTLMEVQYNIINYVMSHAEEMTKEINIRVLKDLKENNISYKHPIEDRKIIEKETKEETNPFEFLDLD